MKVSVLYTRRRNIHCYFTYYQYIEPDFTVHTLGPAGETCCLCLTPDVCVSEVIYHLLYRSKDRQCLAAILADFLYTDNHVCVWSKTPLSHHPHPAFLFAWQQPGARTAVHSDVSLSHSVIITEAFQSSSFVPQRAMLRCNIITLTR